MKCFRWSHLACDGSRPRKSSTSGTTLLITFWSSGWYQHAFVSYLLCFSTSCLSFFWYSCRVCFLCNPCSFSHSAVGDFFYSCGVYFQLYAPSSWLLLQLQGLLSALSTQQLVTSFTAAGYTFSFIHSALFTQQLMTTSYNYRVYFIFIHTALIDCLLLSMQHLVMPLTTAEFTYFHFYPSSSCDYILQLLMLLLVWCTAVSECLSHLQSWRCFVDKTVSDCLLLLPTVLSVLPTHLATEFTPVSPTQQLLSAAYHCRLYCQFYPPYIWWLVNCLLQLQSNFHLCSRLYF